MKPAIKIFNAQKVKKALLAEAKGHEKALETAVKVEGFRLRRMMSDEIKNGAPGGRRFKPLRHITPKRKNAKPLQRLAKMVRYKIDFGRDGIEMHIGFIAGMLRKGGWGGGKYSTWHHIAKIQQEGFLLERGKLERPLGSYRGSRQYIENFITRTFRKGIRLKKKGDSLAKYYFSIKSKKHYRIPARPILEPFWRMHNREAWQNIRKNFRRKLAGHRI